jgi:hypothetical protein
MTDDWQESQRDEEVLQIKVTRANRAVFDRTPDRPQALTTGQDRTGGIAHQRIGKILKSSGSAVEASPDHEHISRRLSDLIEECFPDRPEATRTEDSEPTLR